MHCANPHCRVPAADLTVGVLRLVELDVAPEERVVRSDGGFPVCSVPSRYFWLCPKCSAYLRVKRWTSGGIIFETRTDDGKIECNEDINPFVQPASHKLLVVARRMA